MENRNYWFVRQDCTDGLRSLRDGGDFQEEDVWAVLDDRNEHHQHYCNNNNNEHGVFNTSKPHQTVKPSQLFQRYQLIASAPRIIPRPAAATMISPSSSSSGGGGDFNLRQQSAPVNIPDWPEKKKKVSIGDDDDDADSDHGDAYDDDDEEEDIMAPHEYLARRQARREISSFSVFQGIGRKLRGRDLSQVRNAVLIKTGFLEHQ